MGKSKSNTGIGIIDTVVDTAANKVVTPVAKNVEKNLQNAATGVASVARGDFNNLGRTVLDVALIGTGAGLAINPNDKKRLIGETASERRAREAADRQAALDQQQAADAQAQEIANRNRGFIEEITARAQNRRRSPGIGQSLLGVSSSGGTLLTTSETSR